MRLFESLVQLDDQTRVLDVGGTPFNWQYCSRKPNLILLNIDFASLASIPEHARAVVGDACRMPFRDGVFDVAFCNSVIEHVTPGLQAALASEVERVARQYFVQTPNKWFPIEPHFLAPFFQFLPRPMRRKVVRYATPWGWITRPSRDVAVALVDEISLLDRHALRKLFPRARIIEERLAGLTKSLVARGPM